jgi:hypothetical protein
VTGDQEDILARLRKRLPKRWFGYSTDAAPIVSALLTGAAWALAQFHALYAYIALQTRIATSTGAWLELAANDFFGSRLPRFSGERDPSYSLRIRKEVLRPRNTRQAIDAIIFDLTGKHPDIFEGFHARECGGWGTPALAFGAAGRYGSNNARFEAIITTPPLQGYGIPNRGGWGSRTGGYGVGNFSLVDDTLIVGSGPTRADIIRALDLVRPAGVRFYLRFSDRVTINIVDETG